MEKIIEVDIDNVDDLFEMYNRRKISRELIRYLVESVPKMTKNDTLKVVINNNLAEDIYCSELIKKALDTEIKSNDYKFMYSNKRQLIYFILGVLALLIATLINIEIIKEVILIGAWVLLWDMVEIEIGDDINNRKRKKKLNGLLAADFEEIRK